MNANQAPPRIFFGWWVVISFVVMTFLSVGLRFTVGPFLKPIVADLGLDRASFSLVVAAGHFLYGAFTPLVGRLVDRVGARPVLVAGAVMLGGSLAGTGFVTQLWHLWAIYGVLMALGLAATGPVVAAAVISRWFSRRRATALSTLGVGSMSGMSLLVPVAMWLILTVGWRMTYVICGLAVIVIMVPLCLWVIRESPEAMGTTIDGVSAEPMAAGRTVPVERTDMTQALQTLSFWQIAGGLFTCGFSMSLLSAHGVPMLTDHGYPDMTASWALGVLGGSSVAFAMVLGMIADRFGRRPVLAWLYASRAVIFAGLFLIRDQPVALLVVAVAGGASMAGSIAMSSALTADIFGRFSMGSVFGTIFLVHQTGAALGSWLAGFLFESTGGYGAPFALAIGLLVCAALVSLRLDERPRTVPTLSPVAGS
ncbi:MAG TPA: MFS transporter [Candidatus Limnocylindria bacterium]|nr:MFS transporter [Candidatus Limnocylindria bacterium]